MGQCREAIQKGRWVELAEIVHGIAANAQRVVEVARTHMDANTADPRYKKTLEAAVSRMERGWYVRFC